MFSPAIGDGSWPSYLAARVRANDAAVILCAQKLTSWHLREDLTDLKRDECKSAYGIDSGRTSYRLLAVQTVLLKGNRRSPVPFLSSIASFLCVETAEGSKGRRISL